ncbi:MAG: long-chain-fatty-acid--CoA ligase [bacterium]
MKKISYQDKPWLSHYDKEIPKTIKYQEKCLPDILEATARIFPDKMALFFEGYKTTYRELKIMVDHLASSLINFGIQKGDAVAVLLPNLIPCVVSYYAILKIGAIAVMNNPLSSIPELEYQFNDSGSKCLITLDLLANQMIDLRPHTNIKQIVYTSIGDYLPFPKNLLFPLVAKRKNLAAKVKSSHNVYRWKDILSSPIENPQHMPLSFHDRAMYQYTGGTTGISKGAIITHGNMSTQVQQIAAWFDQFEKGAELLLGALPFFHVFGLTTAMNFPIYMGWGNILIPKPRPEILLKAIHKYKPSFAPLVPTMYIGMINHPDIDKFDMTSINACFSGSAPLPIEVIKEFEKKTGAIILEGFGLTEASPVTHINPIYGQRKIGSIGLPLPDTECRIVNIKNGTTDVPVGETGELLIRGPQIMSGYLNKSDETEAALKEGWLHTGDVATMDEEGYFYIVDRIKDMIISSGYNVYPRDIEEVLYKNPKVEEVAAIGTPHPYRGEAIKVYIVLKKGVTATEKELFEYCKLNLAKYKLPTEVEFRKELPKSKIGKILKKKLREAEYEKQEKIKIFNY